MRQTVKQQHNTWFCNQVETEPKQLELWDELHHDIVESSANTWRDEM